MALQGVTIGNGKTSGGALGGVSIGAQPAPAKALATVAFPISQNLDTSGSKIAENVDKGTALIAPAKPVDTSSSFSKFMGLNNFTAPKVQTSTPAVLPGQLKNQDSTAMGIARNTVKGIPEASAQVSKAITDTIVGKPAELLGKTKFIQEASAGIDSGSESGLFAKEMLHKLSYGMEGLSGLTGGLYQAPKTEGINSGEDFLDKGIKAITQGVGMAVGVSSLGRVAMGIKGASGVVAGLTNLASKLPLVGKYIAPFIQPLVENAAGFAAYGQLDPNLAGDLKARGLKLATDIGTAPLYTALGAIKNAGVSVPASFGLGFGMAKLSGASNQDAVASGLAFSFLDAAGRAQGTRGLTADEIDAKLTQEAFSTLNSYATTRLGPKSTPEEIKTAYYKAAHQTHPDVGGTKESFEAVKSAYDYLSRGGATKPTEAEKSIGLLKGEIKDVTNEHGPEVATQALVDHVGLDQETASRLVTHANIPDKVPTLPKTDEKITADSIAHVKENLPKLVDKYIAEHGNFAGADEAKEFLPGYSDDRSTSDLVQKAAGTISDAVYNKLLDTRQGKGNGVVLMTAGGTGAGKSTAIRSSGYSSKDYSVVFDTNLSNAGSGTKRIQDALDKGYDVHLVFVHTPVKEAYNRVLGRAEQMTRESGSGRPVSAQGHIDMHHGSYDAMHEVIKKFGRNSHVAIDVLDNAGKETKLVEDNLAFIQKEIYNKEHENTLHKTLNDQRSTAHAEGKISNKTNSAFDRAEKLRPAKSSEGNDRGNTEVAPERSVAESVLDTKVEEPPQAEVTELSPELKKQADEDWQDHYADEYGTLADELSDIEKALKDAPKKDTAALELQKTDVIAKQVGLEGEFTFKWRQKGGLHNNAQAGFIDVGAVVKDADAQIKDFIEKTMIPVELSENLTDSFARLEGASQADLETVNKIIKTLDIDKADDESLYFAAENPNAKLTDHQKELKIKFDDPLRKLNQALYERIKNDGVVLPENETYIPRFPKEKPSVMQRVFNPVAGRTASAGQGSVLSKSAPSLKKRTMKAIVDEQGNRTVVSIKKKKVTAFNNKETTDLGTLKIKTTDKLLQEALAPIQAKLATLQTEYRTLASTKSRTMASGKRIGNIKAKMAALSNDMADIEDRFAYSNLNGKVFTANDGKQYKITDATTQEIEQHTNLEYYHSAMASRLMQYMKLRQIDRANQFLESWKASEDFAKIAVKNDQVQPEGWAGTTQVNFRNYWFEPRIAEVLDDVQRQMDSGNFNNAFTAVNRVLANAIFFNGLAHPINVFTIWLYNRGVSGLVLPSNMAAGMKAGARALTALSTKNEDYMELLRNGAHLMASNVTNQKVAENIAQKLNDELNNKPDLRDKILNALGYTGYLNPTIIYRISHDMAWLSNDFLTMQSIFETMETRGMTMSEAIAETARFIPDYRAKPRLLDKPLSAAGKLVGQQRMGGATARWLAKGLVYNRYISLFGSYHVGLFESLKNTVVDTAKGTDWTFSTESNIHRAKSADKMLMLGIMMLVIYPWLDSLAKKAYGSTSYITRSGITKYPWLAYKWAIGDTSTSQAAQQILTPAVLAWETLQQFTDRDFFSGNQITGPGNEGRINHGLNAVAPFIEFQKVASGRATMAEFGMTLLGVHVPKNTATAYQLNSMIYDEKPKVNTQVKKHLAAGDEEGGLKLAQDFNARLQDLIRENDIASNGATTDERVAFFLNQYGLKMPGQKALDNYIAKQGQNIIQRTLPNGQPVVIEDKPLPAEGVIGAITTYAKAIGTDPAEAFSLMFSGQTIKNVDNGVIIVNRMSLAQSQAVKEKGGGNNPGMKLDHIVPLEGGGDNGDSNLQLIPTAQWQANTHVENFIGSQLKAGTMTKAQAREIAIRFKAGQGEILSPDLMKEYNNKYKGQPLSEADAYNFMNTLAK